MKKLLLFSAIIFLFQKQCFCMNNGNLSNVKSIILPALAECKSDSYETRANFWQKTANGDWATDDDGNFKPNNDYIDTIKKNETNNANNVHHWFKSRNDLRLTKILDASLPIRIVCNGTVSAEEMRILDSIDIHLEEKEDKEDNGEIHKYKQYVIDLTQFQNAYRNVNDNFKEREKSNASNIVQKVGLLALLNKSNASEIFYSGKSSLIEGNSTKLPLS